MKGGDVMVFKKFVLYPSSGRYMYDWTALREKVTLDFIYFSLYFFLLLSLCIY